MQGKGPEIREVKSADPAKRVFDGEKVDLYINTGQIGKTFLVKVLRADGRPSLIAVHL